MSKKSDSSKKFIRDLNFLIEVNNETRESFLKDLNEASYNDKQKEFIEKYQDFFNGNIRELGKSYKPNEYELKFKSFEGSFRRAFNTKNFTRKKSEIKIKQYSLQFKKDIITSKKSFELEKQKEQNEQKEKLKREWNKTIGKGIIKNEYGFELPDENPSNQNSLFYNILLNVFPKILTKLKSVHDLSNSKKYLNAQLIYIQIRYDVYQNNQLINSNMFHRSSSFLQGNKSLIKCYGIALDKLMDWIQKILTNPSVEYRFTQIKMVVHRVRLLK